MKYFALHASVNKLEFACRIFMSNIRSASRSVPTRCFDVPVVDWQKNIDKMLWIHVFHKFKGFFRYEYFFYFSVWHKEMCHRRPSFALAS